MRKHFFGFAALSLLLVASSCNKETSETLKSQENKITFRSALGKQTKAQEFTYWTTAIDNDRFTVKSYQSGTATHFQDFTLIYDGTDWGYTEGANPGEIEQPGYALDYYAWYPYAIAPLVSALTVTGGVGTMDYTVAAAAADQEDLIATMVRTGDANITLTFNHLLSQVNFAVQEVPNVKITLSNIKVNGVLPGGTYTFGTTGGSWTSLTGTRVNYDYTSAATFPTTGTTTNPIFYLGNKGGNTASDNANTNALMLMPQEFNAAGTGTITFDYTLYDMATTPNKIGEGSATANLCDFDVTTWAMGKRYLYLIDFTNYFKTGLIAFEVVVNPWTDATEYKVATTLEVAQANASSIEGAIATHNAAKNTTSTLTVFPISLPAAIGTTNLTADIVLNLTSTNANKFAKDDVIKIQCYDTDNIPFIKLGTDVDTYWTLGSSGTVVTLTRTATAY